MIKYFIGYGLIAFSAVTAKLVPEMGEATIMLFGFGCLFIFAKAKTLRRVFR